MIPIIAWSLNVTFNQFRSILYFRNISADLWIIISPDLTTLIHELFNATFEKTLRFYIQIHLSITDRVTQRGLIQQGSTISFVVSYDNLQRYVMLLKYIWSCTCWCGRLNTLETAQLKSIISYEMNILWLYLEYKWMNVHNNVHKFHFVAPPQWVLLYLM